jgi:hypothetical protein
MPYLSTRKIFLLVVCLVGLIAVPYAKTEPALFKDIRRISLDFRDAPIAGVGFIRPLTEGFVVIYNESAFNDSFALARLSSSGIKIKSYKERGNGPGELGAILRLVVTEKSILVSEFKRPIIHEFSHELSFKKDYRIKKPGIIFDLGKHIGVWSLNFSKENNQDKIYMLSVYNRKTFHFIKFSFEIPEVPAFVYLMGGIWPTSKKHYAAIYPTEYQIRLYDENLNFKKNVIKSIPSHVKKYIPWKKSPYSLDNKGYEWMNSWSRLNRLFFIDGRYFIIYWQNKTQYLDIISNDGQLLLKQYVMDKKRTPVFNRKNRIWMLESNDEKTQFSLIETGFQFSTLVKINN